MEFLRLRDHRELAAQAAAWFHAKWGVPEAEYAESIRACLDGGSPVPQWYAVRAGGRIIGGAGVIENDFHVRKDLTPNLCALYVEAAFRGQGIAGALLREICADMGRLGVSALYLVTEHTSFYERYGWQFLCMVRETGTPDQIRMYVRPLSQPGESPLADASPGWVR